MNYELALCPGFVWSGWSDQGLCEVSGWSDQGLCEVSGWSD